MNSNMLDQVCHGTALCKPIDAIVDLFAEKHTQLYTAEIGPRTFFFDGKTRVKEAMRRKCCKALLVIIFLFFPNSLSYSQENTLQKALVLREEAAGLSSQGLVEEAISRSKKSLELLEATLGPEHPDVAYGLNALADLYVDSGEHETAAPLFKRAAFIFQKAYGQDNLDFANSLFGLAYVKRLSGDYAEAEFLCRKVVEIREKGLGPNDQALAQSLNELAEIYKSLEKYSQAELLYRRAIEIFDQALGPDNLPTAIVLKNLSDLYHRQMNYSRAVDLAERSVAIKEKVLGPINIILGLGLKDLANIYSDSNLWTKAEPLLIRALAIQEQDLGSDNFGLVTTLTDLGSLYRKLGNYKKAESAYIRALSIAEKTFGPEDYVLCPQLNQLALLYLNLADFDKAESLYKRSLEIQVNKLGPDHISLAPTLEGLGLLYRASGDFTKAETYYQRALGINQKSYGPQHSRVANSVSNLAHLYEQMGSYGNAEHLFKESLAIMERSFGAENPQLNSFLADLGNFYRGLGEYSKAEKAFSRALEVNEKAYGADHPKLTPCLHHLAWLYADLGYKVKAARLCKRALDIDEKAFGPGDFRTVQSISQMGQACLSLNDYPLAVSYFKHAIEIKEKAYGSDSPEVAHGVISLAIVYGRQSANEKAQDLYKEALRIQEAAYGREHFYVAMTLGHLGFFYSNSGQSDKAILVFQRVLTIQERLFGGEHPEVARTLTIMAAITNSSGNTSDAEQMYSRALKIFETSYGIKHPYVATTLSELAVAAARRGDFKTSLDLFSKTQQIDSDLISQVMGFSNEKDKLKFVFGKQQSLNTFLSLVSLHFSKSHEAIEDGFNAWLRRKGLVLELERDMQFAALFSGDPETMSLFSELCRTRTQVSRLAFSRPNEGAIKGQKETIQKLENRVGELEAQLSRKSNSFAIQQSTAKVDCRKIAARLPADTTLVDFAKINLFSFGSKNEKPKWEPSHYFAFILPARQPEKLNLVDLGDAERIDNTISQFRKELRMMNDSAAMTCSKIYNLVFKPLKDSLGDAKTIFISPDGSLNLFPFEVLQGSNGKYLIEEYSFHYLSASRDLLSFGGVKVNRKKAILIGDPDFDMSAEKSRSGSPPPPKEVDSVSQSNLRSADQGSLQFKRLAHTREEVLAIQSVIGEKQSELYTGKEAVKEVLKSCSVPCILHLATHGFFLKDQNPAQVESPARDLSEALFHDIGTTHQGTMLENPMLRSGIALAGANSSTSTTEASNDDGLMTAEEVRGLRLWDTEMVVLSACDTGLGDVKTGEGVFGLRRAFTQAGAKSLVMSLWSVPDRETKELMIQFYKNIETSGMDRSQALRQAVLKEMEIVEERYGSAYPLCWGGFVFVGDPGRPSVN